MEFFSHQTSYPFMATRKVWYTLSAVLMIASIASFFTRSLNLGIDFTGGVSAHASVQPRRQISTNLRGRSWSRADFTMSREVQNFGSSRDLVVRLPPDPSPECRRDPHQARDGRQERSTRPRRSPQVDVSAARRSVARAENQRSRRPLGFTLAASSSSTSLSGFIPGACPSARSSRSCMTPSW